MSLFKRLKRPSDLLYFNNFVRLFYNFDQFDTNILLRQSRLNVGESGEQRIQKANQVIKYYIEHVYLKLVKENENNITFEFTDKFRKYLKNYEITKTIRNIWNENSNIIIFVIALLTLIFTIASYYK